MGLRGGLFYVAGSGSRAWCRECFAGAGRIAVGVRLRGFLSMGAGCFSPDEAEKPEVVREGFADGLPIGRVPGSRIRDGFPAGFFCAALRGFIRTGLPAVTRSAIGFGRLGCGKRRYGDGIAPALRGGKEVGLLFGRSGPCSFREDAMVRASRQTASRHLRIG